MGYLPSLVGLKFRHSNWVLSSHGLQSRNIELDNGAIIHCWLPKHPNTPAADGRSSSSKVPLVLLHGFGSAGAPAWERQVGELSKRFDLYIPDLLFFGGSYMRREGGGDGQRLKNIHEEEDHRDSMALEDIHEEGDHRDSERSEIFQARCVYEALLRCGVGGASGEQPGGIMVCGHSYGGFVAYRLAHLYGPSLIRRLVFISSGIMMDHRSNDPLLRASGYGTIHELLVPNTPADLKTCLRFVLGTLPPFIPNFIYKDMFQTLFGDRRQEKLELVDGIILGKENSPPLPKIEQEVLIIWGEEDKIFSVDLGHKLKEFLGERAQLITLKGVGHVPPFSKGKELAKLIISFLTT